jgi:hypothetical protein
LGWLKARTRRADRCCRRGASVVAICLEPARSNRRP